MSVTVADLLKLPCLREARVLGGHSALGRFVGAVSVLEYADPGALVDSFFENPSFISGSEIVISGFINIKDDVDAQCRVLRRLSEGGEAALILYYVGIYLPGIDQRLIELADELGFPLICMPENRLDFRYSEVITQTMETIFMDQNKDPHFVSAMLERIAQLPDHRRTLGNVLRMLSDRLRSSLMLLDHTLTHPEIAAWPISAADYLSGILPELTKSGLKSGPLIFKEKNLSLHITVLPVQTDHTPGMNLVMVSENPVQSPASLEDAAEVLRLFINIWNKKEGTIGYSELIRSILNDEPLKMRRLADILGIDVASIHTMWLIRPGKVHRSAELAALNEQVLKICRDFMQDQHLSGPSDIYDNTVALFIQDTPLSSQMLAHAENLMTCLEKEALPVSFGFFTNLPDSASVRQSFLLYQGHLKNARILYPVTPLLTQAELSFSASCAETIARGEAMVRQVTAPLEPLLRADSTIQEELLTTLSAYLLDAQANVTRTAGLLYLHKNTVKYRLHKINSLLGYPVTKMPERNQLYTALAVKRLLKGQ
ncbi:PucR family transcriptional regulator [Eubacterium sp. 1001713B170207_170306_E7]|uniref:PucR family transcriptional regulator n=1 Tax=Eubacterium sp. 1001713B170207_170306_E7 TaxID=2787097 RepID=UPI00189A6427|nr:PucR family transcriptional regulator [Eubacterium sp. 1001713B170207_170306_E7]